MQLVRETQRFTKDPFCAKTYISHSDINCVCDHSGFPSVLARRSFEAEIQYGNARREHVHVFSTGNSRWLLLRPVITFPNSCMYVHAHSIMRGMQHEFEGSRVWLYFRGCSLFNKSCQIIKKNLSRACLVQRSPIIPFSNNCNPLLVYT